MTMFIAFYIVCAVLNCTLMILLHEVFKENSKSRCVYCIATVGITLLSFAVWVAGIAIVAFDIAMRMIKREKVDYGENQKSM